MYSHLSCSPKISCHYHSTSSGLPANTCAVRSYFPTPEYLTHLPGNSINHYAPLKTLFSSEFLSTAEIQHEQILMLKYARFTGDIIWPSYSRHKLMTRRYFDWLKGQIAHKRRFKCSGAPRICRPANAFGYDILAPTRAFQDSRFKQCYSTSLATSNQYELAYSHK